MKTLQPWQKAALDFLDSPLSDDVAALKVAINLRQKREYHDALLALDLAQHCPKCAQSTFSNAENVDITTR